MLRNINTFIFDWDMTLVNSLSASQQVLRELEKEFEVDLCSTDLPRYYGMHFHQGLRDLYQKHEGHLPDFESFRKLYEERFIARFSEIHLQEEAVLTRLIKDGYKVGIVTYNNSKPVRNVLNRHQIDLEVVVGHDHLTPEQGKTHGIGLALQKLNSNKQEAVYIGDHSNDIVEGKQAGVRTVAVPTGFVTRAELESFNPDLILEKLDDIFKYLN